jgi:hypothetical protein
MTVFRFPITAKLNPITASNLTYLATSSIIARLGVAVIRVNENKPSKNNNPQLTQNQKRQSVIERAFVELVGTLLFTVLPLHIAQDAINHFLEKNSKSLQIPQMDDSHPVPAAEREKINQAILKIYGPQKKDLSGFTHDSQGIIFRMLYGKQVTSPSEKSTVIRATLSRLRQELGDGLYGKMMTHLPEMEKFTMRLNRYSCLSLFGSVLFSAFFGGVVTQRMNDNVVAPLTKDLLNQYSSEKPGNLTANTLSVHGDKAEILPRQYTVTPGVFFSSRSASDKVFAGAAFTGKEGSA